MEKGIKEISELIDGLALIGEQAKKISKGGIGVEDIAHLVKLAQEFEVLKDAFGGLKEAGEEIKDLDQSEIIAIIGKLYELVKKVEKA
jgi:hypothetical protein